MITTKRLAFLAALTLALTTFSTRAEIGSTSEERGHIGLGLMLRKLTTVGIFMHTTAHPDDENNAVLALVGRGQGMRTALVTATRGNGGQNEIGPELFEALGVIRTEELAAAHRFDGAEQYFTRAVDFGYSFSTEETLQKWGKQEILGDFVRMIRIIRPDVIVTLRPDGAGGGQHHQTSALLSAEAFRAAADPARFPEHLKDGLRPWQAAKLYQSAGFGFRGEPQPAAGVKLASIDTAVYDALLGRTYAEIGSEARNMHKCQGVAQLLALPGPAVARYRLADTTIAGRKDKDETSLFDGVDTTLAGLARYAGVHAPQGLTQGLAEIARHAEMARTRFEREGEEATIPPILQGLAAVRTLRAQLGTAGLDKSAVFEIDTRLETKEHQLEQAAALALGLRIEALADDGTVVAGQPVKVTAIVANRGETAVELKRLAVEGLEGGTDECKPAGIKSGGIFRCEPTLRVPAGTRLSTPYWKRIGDAGRYEFEPDAPFGLPFRPTPFRARFDLEAKGVPIRVETPIQYRYEGNIFSGEKRMELQVVPRFSVRMTPETVIMPTVPPRGSGRVRRSKGVARDEQRAREVRVTVTNGTKGQASAEVAVDVPKGGRATPPSVSVTFAREDEAVTVRFSVTPPSLATPGEYDVRAMVAAPGFRASAGATSERFDSGYQVVEYPHIQRRHLIVAPRTAMKVIDVKTAPDLTVGYVMGVGDQVPPAIEQLGARLEFIDPDQLAWGDLSRYDAIVTGVRAYERREDLRAHNHRLIQYAESGGTVIVQYNKFEFNDAQYGPYPAKVGSNRVTDEHSPVAALVPDHQVFNRPNKIGEATWKGWVQERGLYFLGDRDSRYVDLVELEDPFEYNKDKKRGALVEANVGKGRWIYVGLGLWRQLPAGTEGAYRLLANLISLGSADKSPTSRAKTQTGGVPPIPNP